MSQLFRLYMVYKVTRYMTELEAMVSSGQFKAKKKEPERMLADFNLYVKTKEALLYGDKQEGRNRLSTP